MKIEKAGNAKNSAVDNSLPKQESKGNHMNLPNTEMEEELQIKCHKNESSLVSGNNFSNTLQKSQNEIQIENFEQI